MVHFDQIEMALSAYKIESSHCNLKGWPGLVSDCADMEVKGHVCAYTRNKVFEQWLTAYYNFIHLAAL